MPFLTNDPLPQCLQTSSDIALSPPIGNRRGCGRYLLEVKCLELVDQRREDAPHALRDDDEAHRLRVGHPERARPLELAALDALDARAEDLADVGPGDQAERQDAERVGRGPEDLAPDA